MLEPAREVAGILGSAVWWTLVEGIELPLAAQRRRTRALQAAADADPADAAKCAPARRRPPGLRDACVRTCTRSRAAVLWCASTALRSHAAP